MEGNRPKSGSLTSAYGYNAVNLQSQSTEWHTRKRTLFIVFVSVLMIVTGTITTLTIKWADIIKAKGTNPKAEHFFIHPFVQTLGMFVGEASCLVVFEILFYYHKWVKKDVNRFGKQKFSPWVFAIPALCDIIGTSTMFVGLNLTNASSFQLLRGSLIIFTALLSVAFFGSKLRLYHWVGMMTVVIGLVVVGLGDVLGEDNSGDAHSVLAGDLLIVTAQIVAAIQMIVEQLFVQGLNVPPLQAIGWEGVFGFCFLGIGLVAMYFIPWHFPSGPIFWEQPTRFEDVIDAVHQIFYIPTLTVAFFLSIVSVAFLNYAGMSVTKEINAITRTTLDNVRTLFIWIFGLAFMWQKFNFFQPIGFLILVIGTFIYYNMIFSWVMKRLHVWPSFCGAPDDED